MRRSGLGADVDRSGVTALPAIVTLDFVVAHAARTTAVERAKSLRFTGTSVWWAASRFVPDHTGRPGRSRERAQKGAGGTLRPAGARTSLVLSRLLGHERHRRR